MSLHAAQPLRVQVLAKEDEGKEQTPLPLPALPPPLGTLFQGYKDLDTEDLDGGGNIINGNSTQKQPLDPVAVSGNSGPATHQLGYLRSIFTPNFHFLICQMGLTHTSQNCAL